MIRWLIPFIARSVIRSGRNLIRRVAGWRRFWIRYLRYKAMAAPDAQPEFGCLFPCVADDSTETPVDATYVHQDAWAMKLIVGNRPDHHVDVGSNHKFVSLLAQVIPVTMVDIRPLPLEVQGIDFRAGSILDLPFEDESVKSLSSLCVIEHIGLGRYGDPVDPEGSAKAIRELKRILARDGDLYVSVPLDDVCRVYYDAHRAFTEEYLRDLFQPLVVVNSVYIYGRNIHPRRGSGFGTGCYHLRKKERSELGAVSGPSG